DLFVPLSFAGRDLMLHFGSAGYTADVFVNGAQVGKGRLPYLPFEADITHAARPGETMSVAVRVSNEESADGLTPGISAEDFAREGRRKDEVFPATRPDFFPYGGLHRPVYLMALPQARLEGARVDTEVDGRKALVHVSAASEGRIGARLRLQERIVAEAAGDGALTLTVDAPSLWSPQTPTLYDLDLALLRDGEPVDALSLPVGIRTIACEGRQLLLNGEPVFLRGFGRHEDADISGRGLNLPMMVKDFGLMRWCGANSFRTSHYPYAEEQLDWADRHGVLVVSELACVNLDFRNVSETTQEHHLAALRAQIARDRNHPSVIMWSLANEPGYLGEPDYNEEKAGPYWDAVFAEARALDPARPLTMANVQYAGVDDPAFARCDVIGLNRYHGWYDAPGQIACGAARLRETMDLLAQRHEKPIALWEFGADALHGEHATYDQLFTEEYQAEFIAAYLDVAERHPACIGAHIWNLADFRTAQHFRRVVDNRKGVFTRARKPKRAAFMLRERWTKGH
ncbi:MAG: glycoside hydrolase family 2 TIM barrel-domain containing protein, partial [Pseudomonadota bacterium]